MKRFFIILFVLALTIGLCACQMSPTPAVTLPTQAQTEKPTEKPTVKPTKKPTEKQTEPTQASTTAPTQVPTVSQSSSQTSRVSGSFTATVRNVMPDYVLDESTPSVAVVMPYQSNLFALDVSQEIAEQLEIGKTYVFTVNTVIADYSKETLQKLGTAALLELIPELKVTDFRIAEGNEIGLASLQLTIE